MDLSTAISATSTPSSSVPGLAASTCFISCATSRELDAVAIDKASGVGGTWYWNKYPGALSDSESFVYQYSFDRDLYAQTPWKTKFVTQPEVLAYLNGVVDRYGLREHIALETGMTQAEFDEISGTWIVRTDRGITYGPASLSPDSVCSRRRTPPTCTASSISRADWCIPVRGPRSWI